MPGQAEKLHPLCCPAFSGRFLGAGLSVMLVLCLPDISSIVLRFQLDIRLLSVDSHSTEMQGVLSLARSSALHSSSRIISPQVSRIPCFFKTRGVPELWPLDAGIVRPRDGGACFTMEQLGTSWAASTWSRLWRGLRRHRWRCLCGLSAVVALPSQYIFAPRCSVWSDKHFA